MRYEVRGKEYFYRLLEPTSTHPLRVRDKSSRIKVARFQFSHM